MSCLDWLAEWAGQDEAKVKRLEPALQLSIRRALAGNAEALSLQRERFVEIAGRHACIEAGGGAKEFRAAGLELAQDPSGSLPRGSARVMLKFQLLQPLMTADGDSFGLFDNVLRRDRLFRRPHLSAASVKGLAADAYQRAFPPAGWTCARSWRDLGDEDSARTRAFRSGDQVGCARRLFGMAEAEDTNRGAGAGCGIGRLQFAPVWFEKVQFLVMNRQDPVTQRGTQPIQFEAVAPGQDGVVDLTYFNAPGFGESDEKTVRSDLARLLWALATWWPVLGLGAKRLAGYGKLEPVEATVYVYAWSGLATLHRESRSGKDAWADLARWIGGGA